MSGNGKSIREQSDLLRYISGEMTGRERNIFEKKMQRDPFIADAIEGLEQISGEEATADLMELRRRLKERSRRRTLYIYAGAAAAITLLVISSIWLYRSGSNNTGGANVTAEFRINTPDTSGTKPTASPVQSGKKETREQVTPGALSESITVPDKPKNKTMKEIAEDDLLMSRVSKQDSARRFAMELLPVQEEREVVLPEVMTISEKKMISDLADIAMKAPAPASGEIRGFVYGAEDSMPIPGAWVNIRGSIQGVVAGLDGGFVLPVSTDTSITLVASFIGMEPTEYKLTGTEEIKIALKQSDISLDEVIVVGYGVEKRGVQTASGKGDIAIDDNTISNYTSAEPINGYPSFRLYIKENTVYPESSKDRSREIVVIDLPVTVTGEKGEPIVVKSPGEAFSEAAIRLIRQGPDWKPALLNGIAIDDTVRIRIVYRRKDG